MTPDVYAVAVEPERAVTRDILAVAARKHTIHGLLELDVTEVRRRAPDVSMTAFFVHCFAKALEAEPELYSVLRGRKLYCFRTVNVGTMVERAVGDRKVVAGIVVRDAAGRSVLDIERQIRGAQTASVAKLQRDVGMSTFLHLPGFLRRAALRYMTARPDTAHRMGIVCGVSAVGMFGDGLGWGLPITPCTTALTIGGIGVRPVVVGGRLAEHEFISITLSFNHDIVDGAPAARFSAALRRLVESGDGLESGEELRPAV